MTALTTSTIHDVGMLRRHASALRTLMVIASLVALAIAGAVEQQASTANDMAENISGVAEAAQSTSAGAGSIQQAAGELARQAEELNEIVNNRLN